MDIKIKSIGIIHSRYKTREEAPRQGKEEISEVEILDKYIEGLKDVESFSHLHIFYFLHKSEGYLLSTTTPHDIEEHGVFATRSPNRPTPLGYAVVELVERKNNILKVRGLDAIEGTPVIDIKPYFPEIDARPFANDGWKGKRKTGFTPRVYEYRTETEWKAGKEAILRSAQKTDVCVGCPPEFGGKPVYWSPEHLLIASVEICIMTTFLDLLSKKKCCISSYKSKAVGKAQLSGRIFKFTNIEIKPIIVTDENTDKIKEFLYKAADKCMVSNTLNIEVVLKPEIMKV
ncbi:MAG: tRNA (N6-threonylcarbamoyladenosine(37)-N6)-methyltransferase TrmO [Candidatus Cloacimonadota bacterium]|nr:MAG: tRNA (N6-threonylcarbamoyladenosine(37)-N6)-methyltransferase TrmO [Candidatus Cloacimonadota bacterium]